MFQNQNAANNGVGSMDPTQQQQQQQLQNLNYNGMQQQQQQHPQQAQQQQQPSRNVRKKQPYVKITEQPAGKALRFRYECEGRSAGSIPGVNSTPENKTFPTIEIVGYKGRAVVVVSCVTKDSPHRPHPHNLVGKEGCKKGVCTLEINSETMRAVFSNLGIQCVKKKDIEAALKAREEIRVDPFKTGFGHRYTPSSIDLNSVRLCFQVFMESEQKGRFTQPLPPVVSEPIFDKKAMSDLVICRLCSCSASVLGNHQIILLCEKVAKEDIAVRFFEEKNDQVVWEAFGEFQHTDVHKQTAIAFKTPRYHTLDITEPAKVFIQLRRPSDGITSEALPFEYVPMDSGRPTFWNLRRNLKRKPDLDIFQQILSVDGGGSSIATKLTAETVEPTEVIDLNTPTTEQREFSTPVPAPAPSPAIAEIAHQQEQVAAEEAAKRRSEEEIDTIIDEKVRELEQQRQQIAPMEPDKQTVVVETIADEPRTLSATDKINEWMKSNEFGQQMDTCDPATVASTVNPKSPPALDEDKTLNDLLDQVAELDEIYTDHVMRRDTYNNALINELHGIDASMPADSTSITGVDEPTAMEIDDNFDDAATYTSLQIAFKNPISLPMPLDIMPPSPPLSNLAPEDTQHYDPVEVQTQSPKKSLTQQAPPPRPLPVATPNSIISAQQPHMHVTAAEEEKRPPLPPKRLRKQDSNAENRSIQANLADGGAGGGTLERKPIGHSQIIIMRTPDQSPPTKRLPPTPGGGGNGSNCNTLPKQKKPGFFSKLFSRRKSKSDLCKAQSEQQLQHGSKGTSISGVSEPGSDHFSRNDASRLSVRSAKSLQPIGSGGVSPAKRSPINKPPKTGKPVGRSVSSVSGKRPALLTADVIHIPLKGDSTNSLPHPEAYSNASTITLGNQLDRRTASALQLAEIPISDGNMELVAIADRQSLRNLCEGQFNVMLDPNVDLTEAEHYALYTSIPPQATMSEFDDTSCYYAPVDADSAYIKRKRQKTGGDPVHLLLQQQQKQQHQNDHQDGRQATNMNCWNTPNIPAIKTEPRDTSPQPFNMYRAPPELTPSPQPHSPSNNYNNHNNTPSPFGMGNAAIAAVAAVGVGGHATNPHLMSPGHHYATGVGGVGGVITNGPVVAGAATPMDMQEYSGAFGHQQQQQQHAVAAHQQHYQGNPFVTSATPHNNWEEKYSTASNANNNNLNSNTNPFTMHNLLSPAAGSGNGVPGGVGNSAHPHWNIPGMQHNSHQQHQQILQQQQQQQQQLQQHQYQQQTSTEASNVAGAIVNNNAGDIGGDNNNNNNNNDQQGPTLSNLLNFDSEQLLRINSEDQQMLRLNSEDLQISNLSIST